MSTFKSYFTINCYAFTIITLMYSILVKAGLFRPMSVDDVFIYFLMTVSLTILIALIDRLPIRSYMLTSFIRIAGIAAVVFTIGIVFEMFPLEWKYVGPILGMILLTYFAVSALLMIRDQADARAINKQLSQRKLDANQAGGEKHE
ncbi:DUF3021 family protein [Paenibacillus sp. 1011MAR3C5]|uniref:DUF3021 family protein n=1 Tax=Paenibacillus sp. 1011MAR3C5 TaxID=1675787 RepID=UPI000E6C0389|nr:DUF3021 family protein [Paenibacillus sp. 1011MAR3C5]RJE85129.1 DUF3021 family protein [Paenibacillus sp. 1011MAR3C5]